MTIRVIPRLDIKGPDLVKGIHFEGLRVLGHPERFARYYYEAGADELLYMDVVASLYGRNTLLDTVERTAREIFVPLTVGGGLRSLDDIKAALRAGADKVALNTAAIRRPDLIPQAAKRFGSSTIVVSIEAVTTPDGRYEAHTDNGREPGAADAVRWAVQAAELGAGEVLVTSVDREGTGRGYDTALVGRVAEAVPIPVIAGGGAGEASHVVDVVVEGRADAVCLAAALHYGALETLSRNAPTFVEGNDEFLRRGGTPRAVGTTTIAEIKTSLAEQGIPARLVLGANDRPTPP